MSRKQKRDLATNGPRIVGAGSKGFWPRWADFIQRQPVLPAVVALIVVVLVAMPFFSLRLGSSDQGNDPTYTTTRQAYDLLSAGFGPGFNGPLQLVAEQKGQVDTQTLDQLAAEVAKQPGVAAVLPPIVLPARNGEQVALINVYPTTSPQSSATTDLITHLRQSTIPGVVSGTGVAVFVGGTTAIFVDFANVLTSKLPLFIGLVVLLSFCLLALVFRSIVIPLTAACMNLLSIGAAFGILVAVFQWGWLGSVFQVNQTGPIEAFLPVMLFAILFGLSMDYEVFLITRIQEEYFKCGDNRTAVRNGLAATGKTITAAALDHDPGLRRVHPRWHPGHQGVRPRPGRRDPHRRGGHPHGRGALGHDPAREVQLVVPEVAPVAPPRDRRPRSPDRTADRHPSPGGRGTRPGLSRRPVPTGPPPRTARGSRARTPPGIPV